MLNKAATSFSGKLAPIAMFTFARPTHTAQTLEALARNHLATETDLIIFQDGLRPDTDVKKHAQTGEIARSAKGFRSIRFIKRSRNFGLADNITTGITEVLSDHDRVIVMEDDLLTAPSFLTFMNTALDRYRDTAEVWHISGWNYPIDVEGLDDAFLWRVMNCWGWATWADRWSHFSLERQKIAAKFDKAARHRFNLDGAHDFHSQIRANLKGSMRTWAIFWYATIFLNGGLCLNPSRSLVENIGHDGSGENCGTTLSQSGLSEAKEVVAFPTFIEEDAKAVARIRHHLMNSGRKKRIMMLLRNLLP